MQKRKRKRARTELNDGEHASLEHHEQVKQALSLDNNTVVVHGGKECTGTVSTVLELLMNMTSQSSSS